MEAHLHALRQEPGETLRAFISRFTKVRGTIPHISDASIITAFRQGVRDENMLEKLATYDVETVTTLFALADKCARAAEGRAWHSPFGWLLFCRRVRHFRSSVHSTAPLPPFQESRNERGAVF